MIVITGAAGFVGFNLAQRLADEGRALKLIDDADRFGRLNAFEGNPEIEVILEDLRDGHFIDRIPAGTTIVHLAALAHVDYSMHFPDEVLSNNMISTLNILKAARARGCKLLFGSSVEVYGSSTGTALDERSVLNPYSPYAASKVAGEVLVSNYFAAFDIPGVIVRFTNLYGPAQLPDRIIPRLIGQAILGLPSEVDARKERDYLHVDDAIEALVRLCDRGAWDQRAYNISSGISSDNHTVADLVLSISNGKARIARSHDRINDGRGQSLVISSEDIQSRIDWRPTVTLEQGLGSTFDWYAANSDWLGQFEDILTADRSGIAFLADAVARQKAAA